MGAYGHIYKGSESPLIQVVWGQGGSPWPATKNLYVNIWKRPIFLNHFLILKGKDIKRRVIILLRDVQPSGLRYKEIIIASHKPQTLKETILLVLFVKLDYNLNLKKS